MTLEELKFAYEKLEAVVACKRLMSSYFVDGTSWAKLPSTSVDLPWGAYDGFKGYLRCYKVDHGMPFDDEGNLLPEMPEDAAMDEPGVMCMHSFNTPVIEVAEDGQTARGVWLSGGCENFGSGESITNEKDYCFSGWAWSKYAFDFKKIDGRWMLWHYQLFGLFIIRYEESWTEVRPYDGLSLMETTEDRPPVRPPYDWSIDTVYPEDYPAPPKPYRTFDDILPGYGYLDYDGSVIERVVENVLSTYDRGEGAPRTASEKDKA